MVQMKKPHENSHEILNEINCFNENFGNISKTEYQKYFLFINTNSNKSLLQNTT